MAKMDITTGNALRVAEELKVNGWKVIDRMVNNHSIEGRRSDGQGGELRVHVHFTRSASVRHAVVVTDDGRYIHNVMGGKDKAGRAIDMIHHLGPVAPDVAEEIATEENETVAEAHAAAKSFNYEELRMLVAVAAAEGRATLVPAGAQGNKTALVEIDGVLIAQASVCTHLVRESPRDDAPVYGTKLLVPLSDRMLGERNAKELARRVSDRADAASAASAAPLEPTPEEFDVELPESRLYQLDTLRDETEPLTKTVTGFRFLVDERSVSDDGQTYPYRIHIRGDDYATLAPQYSEMTMYMDPENDTEQWVFRVSPNTRVKIRGQVYVVGNTFNNTFNNRDLRHVLCPVG